MSTVKSSINEKLKDRRVRLGLGGAAIAIAIATGSVAAVKSIQAPSAPPPQASAVVLPKPPVAGPNVAPKPVIPFTGEGRLALMDQLRSELEVARAQRDIAKMKAEIREAETPSIGGIQASSSSGGLPQLPPFPVGTINSMMPPSASLDMPPLPPSRSGKSADGIPSPVLGASGVQVLEAWGTGGDVQARVSTGSGPKIVRVGDQLAGGKVVSITGSALVIDVKGKRKVIE